VVGGWLLVVGCLFMIVVGCLLLVVAFVLVCLVARAISTARQGVCFVYLAVGDVLLGWVGEGFGQ
jgi:hypothetical protein